MKKLLKVLLIIILILALVAVGAGVYIVNKIKKLNYVPIQPHEIEVTEGIEENNISNITNESKIGEQNTNKIKIHIFFISQKIVMNNRIAF